MIPSHKQQLRVFFYMFFKQRTKMDVDPNAAAEDDTCTFDLGELFGEKPVEIQPLDTDFIPDSDLNALMDQVRDNQTENQQNPPAVKSVADDFNTTETHKSNRFAQLTDKEIDKIAEYNKKKKTRIQTIWGVEVFRGR